MAAAALLVSPALAQAQATDAVGLGLETVDDAQVKRSLTLASDSLVALSAGPGVGGARIQLNKSRFFDRINSTQIKLRIYVTGNLLPGDEEEDEMSLFERETRKALSTTEKINKAVLGDEEEGAPSEEAAREPEPEQDTFLLRARLFMVGSYGSSEAERDFPILGVGRSELHVRTRSLRMGGGVRLDVTPWFSVLPTLSLAYNNIRGLGVGNGTDSALLRLNSNRRLVNWRAESLTFIPQCDFRFRVGFDPFELRLTWELSYLRTRTFSSSTSLQSFSSDSYLAAAKLELDYNTKWQLFGMDVHLIPALRYVRLGGDAPSALNTNDVIGASFSVESDTSDYIPFTSRFGARISYYWGLNLEAWSVGLTYDF
ncbi:MAG TPA: hypothetical protein DEA08_17940 [Planctomycetes bacterium]|nr:hypothetical protein [Planctomycetota bacterium]